MDINTRVIRNNPVWDSTTTASTMTMNGSAQAVSISGKYVIISNQSGNNLLVDVAASGHGILVEPNGSFEIAVAPDADIRLNGPSGSVKIVQFK
jgi:hypothetical protein|tara:strand:+ start:1381 stop:1662 length:282 start_codon:yes stop_codon:yes gene_type:complete